MRWFQALMPREGCAVERSVAHARPTQAPSIWCVG